MTTYLGFSAGWARARMNCLTKKAIHGPDVLKNDDEEEIQDGVDEDDKSENTKFGIKSFKNLREFLERVTINIQHVVKNKMMNYRLKWRKWQNLTFESSIII